MVARIQMGKSLARAFFYNENKVKEGVAECLMAQNYPKDLDRLTEFQRLDFLHKVASLNDGIKVNSLHISLNFDPSESLSRDRMKEIAASYMEQIGFGNQPYLVYQHHDAGHPHVHIVSTQVQMNGKAINIHNIGKGKSEVARKALEIQYGLVKAEGIKANPHTLKSAYVQKVVYGKSESRKAIATVLNEVLKQYKYASLAELNAVLKQYNVVADRGSESSRTFKNNGLHYRILDHEGQPVGVPIKASLFYQKPTLKYLEERFSINETARLPYKTRTKNAIDLYFLKSKRPSLNVLQDALKGQGITAVLRQSDAGLLYGITYIDHKNKCVFNGSTLGKNYSAKAIMERSNTPAIRQLQQGPAAISQDIKHHTKPSLSGAEAHTPDSVIDALLRPEFVPETIPYELSGKKKRKKKKRMNH